MATILNSSGLLVQVFEATPTVPAGSWGNPSWVRGTIGNVQVSTKLAGSISRSSGYGQFDLGGLVLGVRGSILVTFLASTQGMSRTLGYLTDSVSSPTRRIVIGVDPLNRPYLSIRNFAGTEVALVTPSYPATISGAQVTAIMSWDSTQAISGTRFASLQSNNNVVPSGDWTTSPTTAWTSFQPTTVVLGFGVGNDLDFNGQIISFQISNDTIQSSSSQFPASHVFDRFLADGVGASTT